MCTLHFGFDLFALRCISTGSGGHSVRDATDGLMAGASARVT